MPASGRHYRVDYASKAGSFFFTATFFSVTYFGSPSDPYGSGASPLISGARYARALSVMPNHRGG